MKTCKMNTALACYSKADYSPENWANLIAAKTAGDTDIENATSVDEVLDALKYAETAMASIPTLFDDAKAAAHAALADSDQADYSEENWANLIAAKTAGDADIEYAACIEEVTAALSNAEAAIAAVPTLLADAKIAAHGRLDDALAGYSQADYSEENWAILISAKTAGDANIEDAACAEDVMTAANNAQEAMAAVNTLLADAKMTAHMSLNIALAGYEQADYSPDNWTVLIGFKTAGDAAVNQATDIAEVEAAQSAAIAGKIGVQTIAQALAAAKAAAHEALKAALGDYEQCNDPLENGLELSDEIGDTSDVAAEADPQEPQSEVELLTFATETEVVEADIANDTRAASLEELETNDRVPDTVEVNSELEPTPEETTGSESTESV